MFRGDSTKVVEERGIKSKMKREESRKPWRLGEGRRRMMEAFPWCMPLQSVQTESGLYNYGLSPHQLRWSKEEVERYKRSLMVAQI